MTAIVKLSYPWAPFFKKSICSFPRIEKCSLYHFQKKKHLFKAISGTNAIVSLNGRGVISQPIVDLTFHSKEVSLWAFEVQAFIVPFINSRKNCAVVKHWQIGIVLGLFEGFTKIVSKNFALPCSDLRPIRNSLSGRYSFEKVKFEVLPLMAICILSLPRHRFDREICKDDSNPSSGCRYPFSETMLSAVQTAQGVANHIAPVKADHKAADKHEACRQTEMSPPGNIVDVFDDFFFHLTPAKIDTTRYPISRLSS